MRSITTTLAGRTTADAKQVTGRDGKLAAKFRIAVDRDSYDASTSAYSRAGTEFFDVFCHGAVARNVLKSIHRGEPVLVMGRLSSREWEDDKGVVRFTLKVNADYVGHDLTFGTTTYTKALSAADTPDDVDELPPLDHSTGEILDEDAAESTVEDELLGV